MSKIISLFNHKGGVGKTTVAHNLAVSLTKQGKNVLLIDADPQMNLTASVLGLSNSADYGDQTNNDDSWIDLISNYTNITDYFNWNTHKDSIKNDNFKINLFEYKTKNELENTEEDLFSTDIKKAKLAENNNIKRGKLSLLIGDLKLFELEATLYSIATNKTLNRNNGIYRIEESIRSLGKDYDYVIVDTSPSANSILNGIIILGSDYFLVPVYPNFFSLQAVNNLSGVFEYWKKLLEDFRSTPNYKGLSFQPKFLGIIVTMAKKYEKKYVNNNETSYSKNITTSYSARWKNKLNESIESFHLKMIDTNRTVSKSEFKNIFIGQQPFIASELCDFTGKLRDISEIVGVPVVDLDDKLVKDGCKTTGDSSFLIEKITENNHYSKAFNNLLEAYNLLAKSIADKIK